MVPQVGVKACQNFDPLVQDPLKPRIKVLTFESRVPEDMGNSPGNVSDEGGAAPNILFEESFVV